MKIGLFVFQSDSSLDSAQLAKRAEELGFESFWVPEHCVMPVHTTSAAYRRPVSEGIPESYAHIVDPFIALARASAVTHTIKLGTGICLVPERNPLLLAKEIATLDQFSSGRFIFGVGAGWLREETEVMGGDFDHRWTQTRESIEILAFGRPGQFQDREAINEAERAGAGRVTVWLDQTEGEKALDVMEEIAGRVLP